MARTTVELASRMACSSGVTGAATTTTTIGAGAGGAAAASAAMACELMHERLSYSRFHKMRGAVRRAHDASGQATVGLRACGVAHIPRQAVRIPQAVRRFKRNALRLCPRAWSIPPRGAPLHNSVLQSDRPLAPLRSGLSPPFHPRLAPPLWKRLIWKK